MNAAHEMELDTYQGSDMRSWINQIAQYVPIKPTMLTPSHPMMCKVLSGKALCQDGSRLFDLYACRYLGG